MLDPLSGNLLPRIWNFIDRRETGPTSAGSCSDSSGTVSTPWEAVFINLELRHSLNTEE
jgi:hypothetical protein